MHYDGCRIRLSRWISAEQGLLTTDKEEREALEEGEVNTITNPPTAFKETLQPQETLQTHVSNVDK